MNGHSIRLDTVSCAFSGKNVVEDLSLTIAPGEFVAFIGPSGCGKTTTLRLIAGLEKPVSGHIYIDGTDVTQAPPWARETPMVWQNFALFPHLNVEENVAFGLRRKGVARSQIREHVFKALDIVGIADLASRKTSQLSGGQKQRTGIARALVLNPKVLLLDEPLSALDANLRLRMQGELRQLHRKLGVTFVYVTHYQNEAFSLADRVVVMNRGRVEQIGAPVDVFRKPANRFVAEFAGINNVFSARVRNHDGDRSVVETDFGAYALLRLNRLPGSIVEFVVAADAIDILPVQGANREGVEAFIVGVDISDTLATVLLVLAGGKEIRVQKAVRSITSAALREGQRVRLSWPVEENHILAPAVPR